MDRLEKELGRLQQEDIEIPEDVLSKIDLAFNHIREDNKSYKSNETMENSKELKYKNEDNYKEDLEKSKSEKYNNVEYMNKRKDEEREKRGKSLRRKYIAVAASIAVVALIGVIPVRAVINKYIFKFNNPAIEKAVENNYIQNISNESIEREKFNMKLDNVLVDNAHIALDFQLNIKDKGILPKNIDDLDLWSDIELYDEKDKVIDKEGVAGVIAGVHIELDTSDINNNILGMKILFKSSEAKIPNITKLKINVNNIVFRKNNSETKLFSEDLNWNINVDIDENLTKSKLVEYKFVNDNENIKINQAKSLPTGMSLDFDYLEPNHDESLINKTSLIDEEGNRYKCSLWSMGTLPNGVSNIKGVFEGLTSFENPQSFTLEIEREDKSAIDKVHFTK